MDEESIRITLIDWIVGTPCGADVYLMKADIGMMYVYGEHHDKSQFWGDVKMWGETATEVQERYYLDE